LAGVAIKVRALAGAVVSFGVACIFTGVDSTPPATENNEKNRSSLLLAV